VIGSTANIPKQRPKPLGLDDLRTATSEQARPIPYMAGTQRVGVTFISSGLGFRSEDAGGAKKSGGGTKNYFATFAAAVCHGTVSTIREIWFDDEQVWTGPLDRGPGEDFADILIEDRGSARIYWGTETQGIDPVLATFGATEAHPFYTGLAYLVFDGLLLGQNRASAPAIEVVVTRCPAVPGWFTAAAEIGADTNPALALHELLTSERFGLGVSESRIDVSSLNDMGTELATELFGMSVVLNTQTTLREAIVRILEYFDGWHHETVDGKIRFGLTRSTASSTALPVLDEDSIVEEPQISPGTWADTSSGAQVKFTNGALYYKEDVVAAEDSANVFVTGETKLPVFERPWITVPALANTLAVILAQRGGYPKGTAHVVARRSSVVGWMPGDAIKLAWAALGFNHLRCRVKAIELPPAGEQSATLELEFDRGLLNSLYGGLPIYTPPTPPILTALPAARAIATQIPAAITEGVNPQVTVLCVAPDTASDQWWLHHQLPDTSFEEIVRSPAFSVFGWLLDAIPGTIPIRTGTTSFRVALESPAVDLSRFSSGAISAGRIYVLNGTEWIRVVSVALVSAGTYQITGARACVGTDPVATGVGPSGFVFIFDATTVVRHTVATPGSGVQWYKAQPGILGRRSSLASAVPLSVAVSRDAVAPPAPLNLRVDSEHRSARWAGSSDLLVAWDPAEWPAVELFDRWRATSADAAAVLLDIVDGGGTVALSVTVPAGTVSHTLTHAALVSALGSPISFTLRARHQVASRITPSPAELAVTRI
jgi:hypothetical protein